MLLITSKNIACFVIQQTATCAEVLYDDVIEAKERVILAQEKSEIKIPDGSYEVTASTGEKVLQHKQYF